jgi:uncharacterized protein YndB with AHSA1/START domain
MTSQDDMIATTPDREIVITRSFDAPRDLVFDVWTRPEHVVHWWGPNGFTITIQEMNVTPAGVWRYVMHGPDGRDYQNKIVFSVVERPERLVYRHTGAGETASVQFDSTVTFTEERGRTKVTLRARFESNEARDANIAKYHSLEGGKQHLGNLAAYLAKLQGDAR